MRNRLILGLAALSAVALVAPAALAAPAAPVMDGKKVKELVLKVNGGLQSHDDDNADVLGDSDRVNCESPRCAVINFVYKPAKGVKDGLMFTVSWSNPMSDVDLYVGEVSKGGDRSDIGHCGGAATTSEKVFIPASDLKPGKKYALVADMFRSVNEDVTAKVAFGANTVSTRVPAQADGLVYPVNCTL
jgi:hypothetical protein